MSHGSWLDIKERVKQATDIVELVGGYLQLRREGRGYKALCPWHDDSRPSLQVNPERQSFKCWVCDIGGDVFTFMERIEGVEFREALAMLADRAGIPLAPQRSSGLDAAGPGRPVADVNDKRLLYRAMDWARERFHQCLLAESAAQPARAYLAERGISAESIDKFQLGYAPDEWEWALGQARGTPFSPEVLERIGLAVRRRSDAGFYDRFKGRVLFPIFDAQGRCVALGGRVLPGASDDGAKYINSPETPLFTKSRLLYGLHVARDAIRREGVALVMEGYTDCIVAHQSGVQNAVAVLGTALGAEHIQLLRRFADRLRIVSVLDGDEAGRRRANEVLELFVAANADLRVLTLPDEADPCEYLLEHGVAAFRQLVLESADALEHAFQTATRGVDLQRDLHGATAALEQLLATIARAPRLRSDTSIDERLREEKFLQRLAFEFRVPEERLRARLTQLRQKRAVGRPAAGDATASVPVEKLDPLECELLEILVHHPHTIGELAASITADKLPSASCRLVYAKCVQWFAAGEPCDFERLLLEFDDPWVKNLIIAADERGRDKQGSEFELRFRDLLTQFQRRQDDELRRNQTAALQQRQVDPDQGLALLRQIEQLARTRQGISSPTDGSGCSDG